MTECNMFLEKTAYCVDALTVPPDIVRIMKERKKGDYLVNVIYCDVRHVYRAIRNH